MKVLQDNKQTSFLKLMWRLVVVCLYFILQFSNQTKHPNQIQRCDSYHLTVTLLHLHQPIQGWCWRGKEIQQQKKIPCTVTFCNSSQSNSLWQDPSWLHPLCIKKGVQAFIPSAAHRKSQAGVAQVGYTNTLGWAGCSWTDVPCSDAHLATLPYANPRLFCLFCSADDTKQLSNNPYSISLKAAFCFLSGTNQSGCSGVNLNVPPDLPSTEKVNVTDEMQRFLERIIPRCLLCGDTQA